MQEGLVVTAVGKDRPGIVDRISGVIYQHSCNLEDSRMSILGGHFALMVLATGTSGALEKLEKSLHTLADGLELRCHIHPTPVGEVEAKRDALLYRITAVSMDQPGIVHKIAGILAHNGINVASMDTRVTHAPTTGTPVFSLTIDAQVPTELPVTEVRELLGQLAKQEDLDLDIRVVP